MGHRKWDDGEEDNVEWQTVNERISCTTRLCFEYAESFSYNPEEGKARWVCPEGHVSEASLRFE